MEDLRAFFRGFGVAGYLAGLFLVYVVPALGLLYFLVWFWIPDLPPKH